MCFLLFRFQENIIDNDETMDFNIYPNPSNEYAYIDFQTTNGLKGVFKLLDMNGNLLKEFSAKQNTQFILETAQFPSGKYFIEFLSGDHRVTRSLIVIH